jgi:hypothetical protein
MAENIYEDSHVKVEDGDNKSKLLKLQSTAPKKKSIQQNKARNVEEEGGAKPIAKSYFGLCHFE